MTPDLPIHEWLMGQRNLAAGEALAAALPYLAADLGVAAAGFLLDGGDEPALLGLLAEYHRLPEPVRHLCRDRTSALFGALGRAVKHADPAVRGNAVDLIGESGDVRLAYLLGVALHDGQPRIRAAAGRLLLDLADRHLHDRQSELVHLAAGDWTDPARAEAAAGALADRVKRFHYLISALGQALGSFDQHLRTEIMEAVAWCFEHLQEEFGRQAAATRSRAVRAVAEAFRSSPSPRMAGFAYRALTYPELRLVVTRTLGLCRDAAFMAGMVEQAWLTGDAGIRRRLRGIQRLDWLDTGPAAIFALPQVHFTRAVRFIRCSGVPVERQVEVFSELLLAGPRSVQRPALWALVDLDTPASTHTLRQVLDWDDDELSPIALWELMRRHPQDLHVLLLRRLRGESVPLRQVAGEQVSALSFEHYWEAFDGLADSEQVAAGQAMLKVSQNVVGQLRAKARDQSPVHRRRAVNMARRLELIPRLAEEILALARDPDATVRSSAVAALARVEGPLVDRAIRQALDDPDDRVQANAVEALENLGPQECADRLRAKLDHRSSRVRANAIKGLLRFQVREAAEALLRMLQEPNRSHRASALWLVERLALGTMMKRVEAMARLDPDERIRRRAGRILEKLRRSETAECVVSALPEAGDVP